MRIARCGGLDLKGLAKTLSLDVAAEGCLDVTSSENNEIGYTFTRAKDEPPPQSPELYEFPRRPGASVADTVGFEGLMLVRKPRGRPLQRWCARHPPPMCPCARRRSQR